MELVAKLLSLVGDDFDRNSITADPLVKEWFSHGQRRLLIMRMYFLFCDQKGWHESFGLVQWSEASAEEVNESRAPSYESVTGGRP